MPDPQSPLARQDALAFSHMGFYVRELERMAAYYKGVLGFTETDRGDLGTTQLVFLSRDPRDHHQVVLATGRPEGLSFSVINQISFRVADLSVLRHVRARAAAESGTTDLVSATHGNAVSIYFRDPEGNRIEAFVDTPWYCDQPLREPVDLDRSDAEVFAQAEALARRQPKFQDRAAWKRDMARRMGYIQVPGA